jgi:hypothetical protein
MIRTVTLPGVLGALAASCLLASTAMADDKQVCSDAYSKAQTFRDAHKLTVAREQLRICARAECPGFIAKDCAGWLKDVEPRIPSVVFVVKNAAGSDLVDVKVTMDGAPLVTKLDGLAVDVDPGAHTFDFEAPDGKAEEKVVVTEGAKAQRISVTFGAPGTAPAAASPPPPATTESTLSGATAAPAAATTPATAPEATSSSKIDFFAKEPVENGISASFRIGYDLPYGAANGGTGNNNLSAAANGQINFWFDVGYLVNPYLYLGAYFSYGIVEVPGSLGSSATTIGCSSSEITCSGGDVRFGADLQWRFLGPNKFQPWIGLGFLGYERFHVSEDLPSEGMSENGAFDGIEWATPQVGFDYKIFPALSAGLFAGMSFSQYLGTSAVLDGMPQNSTMIGNPLHGWVFLGGRVNYDLHL